MTVYRNGNASVSLSDTDGIPPSGVIVTGTITTGGSSGGGSGDGNGGTDWAAAADRLRQQIERDSGQTKSERSTDG